MTLFKRIYTALILLVAIATQAQDLHFSQFYSNELTLNPALTGRFKEDFRVSAIHRSQWQTIQSGFESSAIGADFNIKGGILNHDKVGVGLLFYTDDESGLMSNNSVLLSGAYHHTLDHHRRHKISVGAQGGYYQKRINIENAQFGNQYQFWQFDPNISSNETLQDMQKGSFNLQSGLMYSFKLSERTELESGLAFYQLYGPDETFVIVENGEKNRLSNRWLWHGGVNYKLSGNFTLSPKILYMRQSRSTDINAGIMGLYDIDKNHEVTLIGGVWYRAGDAAIALAGLRYKNYDIRFSYDATTSNLRNIRNADGLNPSRSVGAWEIAINIYGVLPRALPKNYTVPCGIF